MMIFKQRWLNGLKLVKTVTLLLRSKIGCVGPDWQRVGIKELMSAVIMSKCVKVSKRRLVEMGDGCLGRGLKK